MTTDTKIADAPLALFPRLTPLLNGVGLEELADELDDPGAAYSPGAAIQLARELRRMAVRKAFPPAEYPGLYLTKPREERVDVKV